MSNTALTANYLASKSSAFSSVQDFNGHGTFVASQMIGKTGTATNPSPVTGGAYGASLLALNYETYVAGSYKGIINSVAAGITYAVDNGANVINISLASAVDNELLTALQYASKSGVIVAVAASNQGYTSPTYSANTAQTLGNVIAVGATQYNAYGSDIVQAGLSNQAGSSAAYNYVDAPGANVLGYQIGGGVKAESGTSYAAPEVAAEAAVLEQAIKKSNPALDQTQLAAAVVYAITVGLVGVSPNVITNDATNAYSPNTVTLSTSDTSYIAPAPVINTFNGTYSDGGVGVGNTFQIGETITGNGNINTLNITPDTAIHSGNDTTSFTAANDSIWTNVGKIQNLSITTAGAQILISGVEFNSAFAAGVYLTSTAADGATNVYMDGSHGGTLFTGTETITATTSGAGAQIIDAGSGLTTVMASAKGGAQTIAGANLTAVSVKNTGNGAQTITSTGAGPVTITASDDSGAQTITTGAGNDILNVTLSAGATNIIATGAGNDTINLSYAAGAASTNTITGGVGADTINLGSKTTGTVDKLIYAALSGTNDTGSAITANGALSDVDVISGARTGDVINLGAAAGTLTNALDGGFTNPVVAGGLSAQIVLGNYTGGTNGMFTASATGNSSLVQWADATVGHGTAAVVLVGYADTAATVISGAGLITLA
ncbi:S8 family serine peptidase [Candidatus Methylospira mobilis]|uniref:S8 family serine peptidase n=1 Tax=Candidatus Methylospira mobilis TaxID=1808979 RepID=UPI0028E93E68|nr:S8 family serine peptidase [Candidatus Methylospira mobilis]WNV03282.1 S8 family serine peptidase [Candidatus Methylospira mobilis]